MMTENTPHEIIKGGLKIKWAYHTESADRSVINGLRFAFFEAATTKKRTKNQSPQWRLIEPTHPNMLENVYLLALTDAAFSKFIDSLEERLANANSILSQVLGPLRFTIETEIQRLPIQKYLVEKMLVAAKQHHPTQFDL